MWMRRTEVQNCNSIGDTDPARSCSHDPTTGQLDLFGFEPRARNTYGAVGATAGSTQQRGDPAAGLMPLSPRERHDLPWVAAIFVIVVLGIILFGSMY
jgi:hypothetical protein